VAFSYLIRGIDFAGLKNHRPTAAYDSCVTPRWMIGATVGARITGTALFVEDAAIAADVTPPRRASRRSAASRRYCQWLHVPRR
jgi:hypothetical protein